MTELLITMFQFCVLLHFCMYICISKIVIHENNNFSPFINRNDSAGSGHKQGKYVDFKG